MKAMRESWTDERLDDFRAETAKRFDSVDKRFDSVDERFEKIEGEMKSGFEHVERKMESGFERLDGRIDAMHRTSLQVGGGILVALIGLVATQL
jgi:hypothetical protein